MLEAEHPSIIFPFRFELLLGLCMAFAVGTEYATFGHTTTTPLALSSLLVELVRNSDGYTYLLKYLHVESEMKKNTPDKM